MLKVFFALPMKDKSEYDEYGEKHGVGSEHEPNNDDAGSNENFHSREDIERTSSDTIENEAGIE